MERFLPYLPEERPSSSLEGVIEKELRTADLGRIRRRAVTLGALLLASVVLFVPAVMLMRTELAESGFLSFASLLFSDWSVTLASSKEFLLTLLDSMPVLSLALAAGLFSLLLGTTIAAARLIHFARGRGLRVGI